MNSKTLLILLTFLISLPVYSQTFEEYKKQEEEKFAAYKLKQQKFIDEMQTEFNEYVKQQDEEFANYLEEEWKSYNLFKEKAPPEIPKPPDKPSYNLQNKDSIPEITKLIPTQSSILVDDKPHYKPILKVKETQKSNANLTSLVVSYYGNNLEFKFDKQIKILPPKLIDESTIRDYWLTFSEINSVNILNQLQNYKDIMNLNDWAYYLLVKKFCDTIYPDSETGAELLLWSLLTRSGYKTKIGYTNNDVCLLLPSNNTMYSQQFLIFDGTNYYLTKQVDNDDIRTYEKDYPNANKIIDFNFYQPLNFASNQQSKTLDFNYQQKNYSINIDYNKNIIDFYNDYPQLNIEVYFNAAVSPSSKESLINEFSKIISNMTEAEAVNFLLHFTQTAFKYEIDDSQFGKEKFLFAEETIYYPASDCEDRSVLFAYLIKELLNLKVIGLSYPGHISTALLMSNKTPGDKVVFNNEEYIIADATFENALLGLAMPNYRNKDPNVILLNNSNYFENKRALYWELVNKSGGFRGDNLDDLLIDEAGNAYVTGYFVKNAIFGDYELKTDSDSATRGTFIAKYNRTNELQWAKQICSNQNATGYSITHDENGDIYVIGSFNGEIELEENTPNLFCKENTSDIFIAKYSPDGQLKWIRKGGLDTYPQDNYFTYNVKFTRDGNNKGTTVYSEDEYNNNYCTFFDPSKLLNIYGSFINSTGFGLYSVELKTADEAELDVSQSLKTENDKLIAEEYEKTIAGVFSVLNHIKLTGFTMLGTDAQNTFDMYNPEFQKNYPDVYEGISEMNFIYNNGGVISVETLDGKTVILRELKIKNNAKMKVTQYEDGDAQLDFLTGVQVGKFFVWFKLNFAKMYKNDGNILFDYDSDHSQKLMNLKEDILD